MHRAEYSAKFLIVIGVAILAFLNWAIASSSDALLTKCGFILARNSAKDTEGIAEEAEPLAADGRALFHVASALPRRLSLPHVSQSESGISLSCRIVSTLSAHASNETPSSDPEKVSRAWTG